MHVKALRDWETTVEENDMEQAIPEKPKHKGPKRWCEHGFHPERCLACEELIWNAQGVDALSPDH
jgi:hypothetical protein